MQSKRNLILLLCCLALLMAGPLTAQEAKYSWQKPHAKVLPHGDLAWAPEPFVFEPIGKVAWIDYEGGDDANDGSSARKAWKHHPWDPAAKSRAASGQADTYVFKKGVTYRGSLKVPSGASALLTVDPEWGEGQAWLVGSRTVTGWEKRAHPKMPEGSKVWAAQVDALPRAAWMVDEKGQATRLKLARMPNWEWSDPENRLSEWWQWEQPQWWLQFQGMNKNPNVITVDGKKYHLGIDTKHLGEIGEDAVGGYVWTEWGIPTGNNPYPTKIHAYDPKRKGITVGGPWFDKAAAMLFAGHRYYLEDRPQWLDQAGEYWFERKGKSGTLYVRLPGDIDPNSVTVEAADKLRLIEAGDVGKLRISGLGFRFTNVLWELGEAQFLNPDVLAGAIRIWGSAEHLKVDHCRFEHVQLALRASTAGGQTMKLVEFNDNDIAHTDHGVIEIADRSRARTRKGVGVLTEARVLRNNFHDIAFRGSRGRYTPALHIKCARMAEVAGNIGIRTAAQAIEVYGGKLSKESGEWPFSRQIVHHNKAEDTMLQSSDWAGIELWQGGPFYVYNNTSGAPQGLMQWSDGGKGARFGFAYYYDGGFKGSTFNNIAWARHNPPTGPLGTKAAFQTVLGFQNSYFNNSIYKFQYGWHRQSPAGGRNKYLGNVVQDISKVAMQHAEPAKEKAVNAGHFREGDITQYETNAYEGNVFNDVATLGIYQVKGLIHEDLDGFEADLKKFGYMGDPDVGVMAPKPPMPRASEGDFRLDPGSPAIDRGVKMFVPWALYAVVGEWNFTPNSKDPDRIVDESWYMTNAYVNRDFYSTTPRYPLTRVGGTFVQGPLEDWAKGALELDGKGQYLRLAHAKLVEPYKIPAGGKQNSPGGLVQGRDKPTVDMQDNSFIIEVYFKADRDQGPCLLAGKMDKQAGYALNLDDAGRASLKLVSGGQAPPAITSRTSLSDGKWHHLLAEVDRKRRMVTLYVDGKADGQGSNAVLYQNMSLENKADFLVGKDLAGTLDFLRVSRGTLADAHTTIDELYTWQFDGPHLRDWNNQPPQGKARDAGAIEAR